MGGIEKNPNIQKVKDQAFKNPKELILGVILVLGLIFSYYWFGSLVVGIAAGFFAPWTMKELLARAENFYNTSSKLAAIIWAATVVYFLFHTFWFVVGAAIALTIKLFLPKPQA